LSFDFAGVREIFELKISPMDIVKQFNDYRARMNERISDSDSLIIKRIFNLDTNAYAPGVLDVKTKELIGLTCSLVLRCDDCVKYHLGKCKEVGFKTSEVNEAMGVATLIGGTIVIPHLRRAFEYWEALENV
jgi:AhpD family alkylhydroperoxidase